jgi:RNA polymerase sigma-70 factor, ECF subfamily
VLRSELLRSGGAVIDGSARAAWTELAAKLRPFVARRVRAPHDVDDVVQDVFLRLQRGLPGLRDDDRFGPWVYRVARSAIAEHQRARHRHALTPGDDDLEDAADEADGDDDPDPHGLAANVARFVARLPSPYREALTLTELEGLTQKEAAEMLGISVSGMKSRVQRGRQQLRAALDACCAIALDVRGRVIGCEPRPDGPLPDCRCR